MPHANTPVPMTDGRKRIKKKTVTIIIVAVVVVAIIAGVVAAIAVSNWDTYKQYAADRKVVAVCNQYEIPYEELRFVTMYYKNYLADIYGKTVWDDPATAEEHREELEKLVYENLNQNYVVLSACRALGIETSGAEIDSYVDKQVEALKQEFNSTKEYQEFLDENAMSEHYLRFTLSISFLESAIHYTLMDGGLYTYTLSNVADFMDYVESSGEYVRIIHVYIENKDGEDPDANLKRAQEISDELQAVADPEERRRLMSKYIGSKENDDLTRATESGYYFTTGEMDVIYEKAAFELDFGDVSEPVVCSGGNFILMRLYPEEEYIAKNVTTLLNNYHGVHLGLYIEQFRENCHVDLVEYGRGIDLVAMQ